MFFRVCLLFLVNLNFFDISNIILIKQPVHIGRLTIRQTLNIIWLITNAFNFGDLIDVLNTVNISIQDTVRKKKKTEGNSTPNTHTHTTIQEGISIASTRHKDLSDQCSDLQFVPQGQAGKYIRTVQPHKHSDTRTLDG